ncbi:hypothetical protein FEK33_24915 [Nocardia asteroides NBRC 15531]|uniref:hypothetical protein n=1 Tax=Nocardia asteroides TaxID=1824 RepID=UPI0008E0ADE0|nr:hypothetical protein [Nocardia asteroides]TLF63297.1 hypothetical protein FEK33_24915 [Nocardia asteroides NBRC 15531]UGT47289.1 hypothetical protein LT345_22620 [Nocardia asteroides]SFM73627.1 hypothetical protein SAMN05444423_10450 [Nocardia asteroides]VEG33820.1 Uncharacterised protein [Nocardia asteroides]
MAAGSVITLGVSTERGAVHAVAFAAEGATLTDRMLLRRTVRAGGDGRADVAAAVQTALDTMAAELDDEHEIAGVAVSYRDAVERRAIVTRLAPTPWRTASLVSAKSAHLFVAGAMTWLDEFENLLVYEAVPGHQAMTLIDPGRQRVLAASAQTGAPTPDALRAGVSAAWDQFEAASVRPGAVVLVGTSADAPAVREAVAGFGVPVLPCRLAPFAPAAGAALVALGDAVDVPVPVAAQSKRGTALVAAAASLLAGGLVAGGSYALMSGGPQAVDNTAVSSEPGAGPAAPVVPQVPEAGPVADTGSGESGTSGGVNSGSGLQVSPAGEPSGSSPYDVVSPNPQLIDPGQFPLEYPTQLYGDAPQDEPLPLEPAAPIVPQTPAAAPTVPGTGIPMGMQPAQAPAPEGPSSASAD